MYQHRQFLNYTMGLGLALALSLQLVPALAQVDTVVGIVEHVPLEGDPKRITASNQSERIFQHDEIFDGDTVSNNRFACIFALVLDEVRLTLGRGGSLRFSTHSAAGLTQASDQLTLDLEAGSTKIEIPDTSGNSIRVRTPNTEVQLGRGEYAIAVTEDGLTEVIAYNGPMKVASTAADGISLGQSGKLIHAIHQDGKIKVLAEGAWGSLRQPPKLKGLDCPIAEPGYDGGGNGSGSGGSGGGAGGGGHG